MAGMCRKTGRRIEGWDHIAQSLEILLSLRKASLIERRDVYSDAPALVDAPATPSVLLDHYVAIATAIDRFEPRVELIGFRLQQADESGDATILVDIKDRRTDEQYEFEVPR